MKTKPKLKLSIIFIASLSLIILVLITSLSFISMNSLYHLGKYAVSVDKKNIKDTATFLFLEITNRTAEEYSTYFNDVKKSVAMLSKRTNQMLSRFSHEEVLKINKDTLHSNIKLAKFKNNNFYINNKSFANTKAFVLYWGSQQNLPETEKTLTAIASWFFPYAEALVHLNRKYFFHIWLISPEDNFYMFDPLTFPEEERELYKKVKNREYVKKYFDDFVKENENINTPTWGKPYKGIRDILKISVTSPVRDKTNQDLKAIVGVDINFGRILKAMNNASMISDTNVADSKEWKKIYNKMDAFTFIIDKDANIIFFPEEKMDEFQIDHMKRDKTNLKDSTKNEVRQLADIMTSKSNGVQTVNLKGTKHIVAYSKIHSTNWVLGFVTSENALMTSAQKTIVKMKQAGETLKFRFLIVSILFLVITILVVTLFFKYLLFNPLLEIRQKIKKFGKGNFDIKLKERKTVEISELSTTFNYLGKELQDYIRNLKKETAARQSIETEVKIAAEMQQMILPNHSQYANRKEFELHSKLVAAKDVSGDFYDYFYIDNDRIAFLIADVAGKGLRAAFFMAMSKVLLKSQSSKIKNNPAKVLEEVNSILSSENKASMFVTVFLCFYNIKTGELLYANGGHHETILLNNRGEISTFGVSNELALGFFQDAKYTLHKKTINKGDSLFLYTDGIIEAFSPKGEQYGEERLFDILKENSHSSLDQLSNTVVNDVTMFEKDMRFDDITLIIFKRTL